LIVVTTLSRFVGLVSGSPLMMTMSASLPALSVPISFARSADTAAFFVGIATMSFGENVSCSERSSSASVSMAN
jgi:hypothetical protein